MTREGGLEQFNLRHLRYFLAVCESGSFRAASATLNIAQSAVSRRVADLEHLFGVRLLERHARGVALTEAGAALRDSARHIDREIADARAALRRYLEGAEGTLAAGLFGTTARLGFVPELIARFRAAHPRIRLDIQPLPQGEPDHAALAALDIGVLDARPREADGRKLLRVYAGEYWVALPRGHPLARAAAIPFAGLCAADLIGIPQPVAPAVYDRLIREAARRGHALDIVHETDSECSRLAFAAAGMGIALVSPLAITHDQHFAVDYRPIADAPLPFELWLSVRNGATADRFAELTRALLAELPSLARPA